MFNKYGRFFQIDFLLKWFTYNVVWKSAYGKVPKLDKLRVIQNLVANGSCALLVANLPNAWSALFLFVLP